VRDGGGYWYVCAGPATGRGAGTRTGCPAGVAGRAGGTGLLARRALQPAGDDRADDGDAEHVAELP